MMDELTPDGRADMRTRWAVFSCASFVDCDCSTFERAIVELANRLLGMGPLVELYEGKTSRLARFPLRGKGKV